MTEEQAARVSEIRARIGELNAIIAREGQGLLGSLAFVYGAVLGAAGDVDALMVAVEQLGRGQYLHGDEDDLHWVRIDATRLIDARRERLCLCRELAKLERGEA